MKQDINEMVACGAQAPDSVFDPKTGVNQGPVVSLPGDPGGFEPDFNEAGRTPEKFILRQSVIIPNVSRTEGRNIKEKSNEQQKEAE